MDLSLGFSHHRRTSKFEYPFSLFKSKSCSENVMPVKVPLGTDTSNNMYDNAGDSRVPRWMLQGCSSKTNLVHKSYNISENSLCNSKDMIPKLSSAAISISQQTIVGGFVGSKNYAGGSIFGEHSQIWDIILCKIMDLMSSSKVNPLESKSMSHGANNTKICYSSCQTSHFLNKDSSSNEISNKVPGMQVSSVNIPENSISGCVDSSSERVLKGMKSVLSEECDHSKSVLNKSAERPSSNLTTPLREKYSAVVNGTCKNDFKSVLSESSSVETSPVHEIPQRSCVIKSPLPLKQSYAEVAKTVPPKPLRPQSGVFCRETPNYKKKIMRSKSNRYSNKGRGVRSMNKSPSQKMADIIIDGDTRWKSKVRSKRLEFQGSRPIPILSRCGSSSGNESEVRNSLEISFCVEPEVGSENGLCFEVVEKEPMNVCLRGRCPSESSVDSEDSFVVFAGSPESSISSSPYSTCVFSSVELDEESDDESISSSDYSSSEDDESVDTVDFQSCSPSARIGLVSREHFKDHTKEIKKKKVHFAEGSALAVVRPMITWSFAYREARRGNWEVYSRDRARFQCRINNLAPVLNLVLDPKHRKRIFESRFIER